jgi:hypothetical protein
MIEIQLKKKKIYLLRKTHILVENKNTYYENAHIFLYLTSNVHKIILLIQNCYIFNFVYPQN